VWPSSNNIRCELWIQNLSYKYTLLGQYIDSYVYGTECPLDCPLDLPAVDLMLKCNISLVRNSVVMFFRFSGSICNCGSSGEWLGSRWSKLTRVRRCSGLVRHAPAVLIHTHVYMDMLSYLSIFLSLIPGHTARWCPMPFFAFFPCAFWSFFLFLCHWISFVVFLYDRKYSGFLSLWSVVFSFFISWTWISILFKKWKV